MLELNEVCFSYDNGFALKDVTFKVEKGSFVLLVGANGSGKTTLLKILAGLLPIASGSIKVDGKTVSDRELRTLCCYMFHNPFEQIVGSTVDEDIAFGLESLGLSRKLIQDKVIKALDIFHLHENAHANPFTLSAGTAQKLVAASLYVLEPEIFLLDEPTSMLDDSGVAELINALSQLKALGKTILVSTHEPKIFADLATSIIHMKDGQVDFQGPVDDFLERRFDDVEF